MESKAPNEETGLEMSNLYHSIDDGFEAVLRDHPNEVFGRHAGWNFNGRVWFDGQHFVEEVWRLGVIQEVITADSLRALMTNVNEKYGYD